MRRSGTWLNVFRGMVAKQRVLYDEAILITVGVDIPSEDDLTSTLVVNNYSGFYTSTVTVL